MLTQSAAIGYLVVVPSAVYLHDYLAVAYPLADGALAVQQSLDANHPSSGSKLGRAVLRRGQREHGGDAQHRAVHPGIRRLSACWSRR